MSDYGDIQIDIKLVNHQKQPGTLKCSMQYVLWEPDLIGQPLAIPLATVKSHKISADGKDKVQIRLIINDGTATVLIKKYLKKLKLKSRHSTLPIITHRAMQRHSVIGSRFTFPN